jgi:hypothetical protein
MTESFQALLAPDRLNTLVAPAVFVIDLHVDPSDPRARDDRYILLNEDGSEHQRRTVADDAVPGDDRLTLVFTGLRHGLRYTLLVDEGREGHHYAFHQMLLEDLLRFADETHADGGGSGEAPHPDGYDSLEFEEHAPEVPEELREPRAQAGGSVRDRRSTEGVDDPIV